MLAIGPYQLKSNLLLAPMAGVTDVTFRQLCLEQGAGCAASEMISADTSLHATDKTRRRVRRVDAEAPHIVQIAGSEPDKIAAAAIMNVQEGAEIIDINMGCPAKKVCKKLAGSALLSDEKLVARILNAVVTSVDVPVTLKIRTGSCPATRNGVRIAKLAQSAGIQCLAVHGRTRADKFNGQAEYDTIRDIKQAVDIPIIANGDIVDAATARQVLEYTGADGLMVGRAAQGDPFIFRRILRALQQTSSVADIQQGARKSASAGDPAPVVESASSDLFSDETTDQEIHEVLQRHLQGIYELYGEYRGVRIARKHISWYLKAKRGAAAFRQRANQAESAMEQLAIVDQFFNAPDKHPEEQNLLH